MKKFLAILLLLALLGTTALAANVKFIGSCHVYKKAGSGKTATVIQKGSVAKKTAAKGNWVQVQLTDTKKTKVWVRKKYVKDTSSSGFVTYSAGGYGYSVEGKGKAESTKYKTGKLTWKANLRAKPSLSGKHVITVPKGATVKILGKKKADSRGIYWYKASYKGKTGWISNAVDN